MAEYLVLIYDDENDWATVDDGARAALLDKHNAFAEKHGAAMKGGNALSPVATTTTIRRSGSELSTTDGPFAEAKEVLGGYYLIEAKDLDEALEIAKDVPFINGGLEVRPVLAM
jgi:hypothetical protein